MTDHDVTLAEVRTEMRAIRESMQKMSDALDRLTRIEVQNQSRDEKIEELRADVSELRKRVWAFTFIGVDEVGHYKDPAPIDALRSRMRTTHPGVRLELFMTANPGGAGQDWLRKRYIDPAPPLTPHKDKETGLWRVYIPSWMTDNPNLMRDKSYVKRIKASGPTWLVRALIAGDWNVSVAGKIFMPEWWHWGNAGGQVHEQWKSGYLPPLRTVIQAWDTDFGKGNDNCAMVTLEPDLHRHLIEPSGILQARLSLHERTNLSRLR